MPFLDVNSVHYSPAEKAANEAALAAAEAAILPKARNLTPDERQQYGSINEQHKLLVNKDKDYHDNQPALDSPDVDWAEFVLDYGDRRHFESLEHRLEALLAAVRDTKTLYDYDNYQNALLDYQYTDYKANRTNDPAYEAKYNDLRQFFPNT